MCKDIITTGQPVIKIDDIDLVSKRVDEVLRLAEKQLQHPRPYNNNPLLSHKEVKEQIEEACHHLWKIQMVLNGLDPRIHGDYIIPSDRTEDHD
jgi:hypothetical protein